MRKAIISGPRRAELIEVPTPVAKDDWVLVQLKAIPMCAEYKDFILGKSWDLGHEAVGEVVSVDAARHVRPGDRVVVMPGLPCGQCEHCRSGEYMFCLNQRSTEGYLPAETGLATHADYILKPERCLIPIPDDISYDMASLALCALGPSLGAFDRMNVSAFDTVLITGLGPVGMGAIVNARFRGAKAIAVEALPYRQSMARAMGVDAIVSPEDPDALDQIRAHAGERGVHAAIDCSGIVAAQRLCIDALKRRGRMAFVGECHDATPLNVSDDMLRKGITLYGCWHYDINLYDSMMQVIRESPYAPLLISHHFALEEIQRAFELSASPDHVKILLHP